MAYGKIVCNYPSSTRAQKSPEHPRTCNPQQGFWSQKPDIWRARGALPNQVESAKGLRVQAEILRAPQCSLAASPVESR
jgi:hypothetical protein